ncbi:MAG: 50S ribosomal protein L34e [Candidatus Woesearchaeota archaeon]|jgi:large subunit ribosomal protein L34e|nr:50S ribosomal protein L34e [Candidatus Woesearchaeota archaeon]MDP6138481.1 50S ribosomal protein L34e [Candidatus Woesearchaeota archaeon]MDP6265524.1 50S ribosomal protein L34e [Candidatus Woesearchaeota archaeon]MDP6600146.1 50S ribosomal protein L34e [Candidatus Woesearchaeota archaeon]MDP7322765.1 50S ribosomal protein L34e [Candidatus Woesearchaeota archaeon]|tara:strand:- start:2067 stop:2336 length:270 start_codon:yes stop_codon:yes gene_type:complete
MPEPYKRSRSLRRLQVKVSGGRTALHYKKRKPGKAKCSNCETLLKSVPRERPLKMHKLPKTKKRPERPYGGNLCSKCMRSLIIEKARLQ